ncbi:MAG: hypothetical protein JW719_02615 [Pirellulales bacterium]|nr:hypothetical protein [Pirellulales bacterium]
MRRLILWGTCVLLVLGRTVWAEVPPSHHTDVSGVESTAGEQASTPRPVLEELQPPIYYLEDAQGRLRPAFGFTLEDFRRAYDQMHKLAPEARSPAYLLKKVALEGKAEGHYARLNLDFDIQPRREETIRVPLMFGRAVIDGQPKHEGGDSPVLAFDKTSGGYVAWIKGKPEQSYRLSLKTFFPLTVVGDKTTLRLRVPSATESELKFTVPVAGAVVEISEGAVLETAAANGGSATQLNIGGLRGDVELAWRRPEIRETAPTVLEAVGEILVHIDNRAIHSQAALDVRGYGKAFDQFRVRLPLGAELIPANGSLYTVAEIAAESTSARTGRLVEVRLAKKTLGPINVRFETRRALDANLFEKWIELTGFDVIGASRQSGHLAVVVTSDLDLLWNPQLNVQQTEDLPDNLMDEELVAGFKYFTQPCSLRARVAPRRTRVNVEPQYLALVDVDRIRLEAVLKYTVRGKKTRVLDVDLGDWEYDEIGPDNVVAADRVLQNESGLLSIPLRQPSSGKIELSLRAHRRLDVKEGTLRLSFPRPEATTSGPATVVIVPEDRVQLTADGTATTGLTRQQAAPPMTVPEHQQPPLFYRGDTAKAVFVASHRVHGQRIAVNATTTVVLDRQDTEVRQRFSYKIDYEPIDTLALEIPHELENLEDLEFRVDGQRLTPMIVSPNAAAKAPDQDGPIRLDLALGQPRIGACDLEVGYSLAGYPLVPRSSVRGVVPLVMPIDGELVGNRLLVAASDEMQIAMADGPWKRQPETPESGVAGSTGRSVLEFEAVGPTNNAELLVSLETRENANAMVVQRALVQTGLGRSARQDRAIFRFTTREKYLDVVLPRGTVLSDTAVSLNGKPIETHAVSKTTLRINLPESAFGRPWLLEVNSRGTAVPLLRGRSKLELPRLGKEPWIRRMYWQLTLPKNDHVVRAPSELAGEYRWQWNGLFWGRQPLLKTADLERWVGASEDPKVVAGDESYLFSGFGPSKTFELAILGRSWIVLGASGAALVLGLLLIYVPASRHPAALLILAVVLGSAALVYPEPTLLVLQAASLGLALTLVAGLLERSVARRRRGLVTLQTARRGMEKGSTQTHPSAVVVAGDATEPLIPREIVRDEPSSGVEPTNAGSGESP